MQCCVPMTNGQGCQPEGIGYCRAGQRAAAQQTTPLVCLGCTDTESSVEWRAYLGRCSVCGPRSRRTAAHGQRQGRCGAGRRAAAAQQRAQVQACSSAPRRLLRLGELRQEGGCLGACRPTEGLSGEIHVQLRTWLATLPQIWAAGSAWGSVGKGCQGIPAPARSAKARSREGARLQHRLSRWRPGPAGSAAAAA